MQVQYRHATHLAITVACFFYALSSLGEVAYFSASFQGETTSIQGSVRYAQDTPYVSLDELVTGLGGGVRVLPDRIQISVSGASASISMNDVAVTMPGRSFSLTHPARADADKAYLALADVADFFSQACQVRIVRVEREQPSPMLTPIDPEEFIEEEPASLLTPMTLPQASEEGELIPLEAPPTPPELPDAEEVNDALDGEQEKTPEEAPTATPLQEGEAVSDEGISPSPSAGAIILDPGHGGRDQGALGSSGGVEKDLVLDIALRTRRILKETTAVALYLTRDVDKDLSMGDRIAFARNQTEALFVSLHLGYVASPRADGATIFFGGAEQNAHTEAASVFAYRAAQSLGHEEGLGTVTLRGMPLVSQRELEMPCILVELAYLSNPSVETRLAEEEGREILAQALARALSRALADEALE